MRRIVPQHSTPQREVQSWWEETNLRIAYGFVVGRPQPRRLWAGEVCPQSTLKAVYHRMAGKGTVQPRRVFLRDLKFSRVYCVLKAYLDESYDTSTMCVGGWICDEDSWKRIEGKWLARIEYERRLEIKQGHKPIQRYHATDCANLKREFAPKNGWTIERQIGLTKKLIGIVGEADPQPVGIAIGMSLKELKAVRPDFTDQELKWHSYSFCVSECLANIGNIMREQFMHDKVSVVYEDTKELGEAALD